MSLLKVCLLLILLGTVLGFGCRYGIWIFDTYCKMAGDLAKFLGRCINTLFPPKGKP